MGLFNKPCDHFDLITTFHDLHTGGDGEVYVRGDSRCRTCGERRPTGAIRLPKVVSEVLHENIHIGTLERKVTDDRKRVAEAVEVVYENIDKRAMYNAINGIVHDAMKKAFVEG